MVSISASFSTTSRSELGHARSENGSNRTIRRWLKLHAESASPSKWGADPQADPQGSFRNPLRNSGHSRPGPRANLSASRPRSVHPTNSGALKVYGRRSPPPATRGCIARVLPPVPAAASSATRLSAGESETHQPDDEDDGGDNPQSVDGKSQSAQKQCEQKNQQDDRHELLLSSECGRTFVTR